MPTPPPPYSPSKNLHRFKRMSQSKKQQEIKSKYNSRIKIKKTRRNSQQNLAIRNPDYLKGRLSTIEEEDLERYNYTPSPSAIQRTPRGRGVIVGRFKVYDESPSESKEEPKQANQSQNQPHVIKKGRFTIVSSPSPEEHKQSMNPSESHPRVVKKGRFTIVSPPSSQSPITSPNKKK